MKTQDNVRADTKVVKERSVSGTSLLNNLSPLNVGKFRPRRTSEGLKTLQDDFYLDLSWFQISQRIVVPGDQLP